MLNLQWQKLLCASRVRDVFGGKPSVKSPGDARSEFERDYGRCVFSAPVRRLQDKAQVFPMEAHDSVRTRLTHSLEVSSVARSLGSEIGKWLVSTNRIDPESSRSIEAIAATCGLLHDIGNPPFGHAGEKAISEWFLSRAEINSKFDPKSQRYWDFAKWEGNAQTIRLVSKLQVLFDEFGLNLTCGTLSALCKYTAKSHETDPGEQVHERFKPGYFFSENEVIDRTREATGTGRARNPITYLVEAADDIVYATVDLEDAIKKGVITFNQLTEFVGEATKKDKHFANALKLTNEKAEGAVQKGRDLDEALSQAFRTYAINEMIVASLEKFKEKATYERIMAGDYHGELVFDSSAASLVQACKDLAKAQVYKSAEVLRIELMGKKVIQDLLDLFWTGAKAGKTEMSHKGFQGKAYLLMSSNYRNVFESRLQDATAAEDRDLELDAYTRVQLVCDYVAGMTDTFAVTQHRRLMNGN